MPNWHYQHTCAEQQIVRPETTKVFEQPNTAKLRAVNLTAGQAVTLEWVMLDSRGMAVDLTNCGLLAPTSSSLSEPSADSSSAAEFPAVWLRFKEAVATLQQRCPQTEVLGEVVTPEAGIVRFPLTAAQTGKHGIYLADIGVFNEAGELAMVNQGYLVIDPSAFGDSQPRGMLSVREIRIFLRDNDAVDNELLDNVDFDLPEIAFAIQRPLDYWNDNTPPDVFFTTQNFPYRYYWLIGVTATLFRIAAEHYRRNQYNTAAGGVSRDDKNKWQQYEQVAQMRWQEYTDWARKQKIALNVANGFGSFSSAYR